MQAVILGPGDELLAHIALEDGDFEFFGNGALTVTIQAAGRPHWFILAEDDGRVIGSGMFGRDIEINTQRVAPGDRLEIKLSIA